MALLARLKPYNVKKGHLTRIYMIDGARFYEERGWYEVSDDFGEKLRGLHQEHYDEDSPFLFDVCTPDQAEALERREQQQIEVKATARRPVVNVASPRLRDRGDESGDLTSEDIKKPDPPKMIDPAEDEDEDEEKPDEDEGRAVEVGRVSPPASQGRSTPPTRRRR